MSRRENSALGWIERELETLTGEHLLRELHVHRRGQGGHIVLDDQELVNFGSNDYLGLAGDPRVVRAAQQAAAQEGWGAGASPLVTGRAHAHSRLESRLAEFEGAEAALLFSSGYAANMGTIPALVGRGDAIFSDEKNHASIVDGCRLSRAEVHKFPHRDVDWLEQMLRSSHDYRRRLIVTDSVFSMDGDLAPLVRLADLADEFGCMLMVDEAHATGVFGARGRGLVEANELEARVHVRVGTLSKALGSAGGFVTGSRALISWLANRARSYVFSTAHPPAESAAALEAIEILEEEPQRRTRLLEQATRLREHLRSEGWNVGDSVSQIIPVIIGDPQGAVEISRRLREEGLLVPAIRPPSVPAGESLLRISLTSAHAPQMVDRLTAAFRHCRDAVAL